MPKMKRLLMALALLPLMAAAETEVVDGIEWTYVMIGDTAQVVGDGLSTNPAIPSSTAGAITIPSTLGGCPVTSIGDFAFEDCSGLTSVTIPSSVTSIGRDSFWGCGGLTSVTIPLNVKHIGSGAFRRCTKLIAINVEHGNLAYSSHDGVLYDKSITELVQYPGGKDGVLKLPSSVSNIGAGAFDRAFGLTAIDVEKGNKVYASQDGILYDYNKTTLIRCPNGKIGTVSIPSSVISIEDYSFVHCEKLTAITLSPRVTTIGNEAFLGCSALLSVIIPKGVIGIGELAFNNCAGLTSVTFLGSKPHVEDMDGLFWGSPRLHVYAYADQGWTIGEVWEGVMVEQASSGILPTYAEDFASFVPGEVVSFDTGLIGYTASGLPSGLRYDKTTGMITGAATRPTAAEGVIVKFTKTGEPDAERTIVVGPLPTIGVALEGDSDGCKVTGAGAYLVGKTVTLKATAPKGTAFVGFFKDGEPWPNESDSKKTSLAYTMDKDDVSLVAKFEKEKMSVGCAGLSDGSFTAGVAGSPEGIPLEIETQSGIKSVKVEKLPAGMKYDAKKERIIGAPTKAGDNTVVITVTAVSGAVEKKEIKVPVAAMPETAVGTFNGFVANGEQRIGTFALTTTDAGKLTAKVITARGTVSFSGTCWDSAEGGVFKVTLTSKKGEFMTLALDSNAAWDANQLTGTYSPSNMSGWFDLSAQRNAFGKTWYFTAVGDERTGWTFVYTKDAKAAALTVTLKADGATAIAGKLPNGADAKGTSASLKVSASGYANVGGMTAGAIIADFAPIVTVNKVKKVLSVHANLWFDLSDEHDEGVGGAELVK